MATQNPIEYEGTHPLPEAQLDRFLFRLEIGYPSFEEELYLLMNEYEQNRQSLSVVLSSEELTSLKEEVNQVFVDPVLLLLLPYNS